LTEAAFAGASVDAYCDNIGTCCARAGFGYDAAACKQASAASVPVAAQRRRYDPAGGTACVAAIEAQARACRFDYTQHACEKVFVGSVQLGGECSDYGDCDPSTGGVCGYATPDASTQTCIVPPHAKTGEVCSGTCFGVGVPEICQAYAHAPGALCHESDGLLCNSAYVCQPYPQVGEACEALCATGATCATGICVARNPIGDSCLSDGDCVLPALCNFSGVCALPAVDGQPCAQNIECESASCVNALCVESLVSPGSCGG
jgi:hypothetical protein